MHSVKRIEIIANSFELKVLDGLKQAGVSGYMVIRNVAGRVYRRLEDLDMTMLDNIYVIAVCAPEKPVEIIRPILNNLEAPVIFRMPWKLL